MSKTQEGEVNMNLWHLLGLSGQKYICPISPRAGESPRFWKDSPAHTGVFANAKDIIIPDPRENSLPVYAPASGRVLTLVQNNTKWGKTLDFLPFLNYITLETQIPNEFYQICHIAAMSCPFKEGDFVAARELVAQTGVNGHMTDPRHIHFLVGIRKKQYIQGFKSLRIRWQKA